MAIKAVLFDLDGTLWREGSIDWDLVERVQVERLEPDFLSLDLGHVDRRRFANRVRVRAIAASQAPSPDLREISGATVVREALQDCGGDCRLADAAELWERLHVPFRHLNYEPFEDTAPALLQLRAAGVRMAVFTSRPLSRRLIQRAMLDAGIPDVFQAVVTSGDVGYRKPHHAGFTTALGLLGMAPSDAAFVGDTYANDIEPALALGMTAVLRVATTADAEPKPYHTVTSLLELPVILGLTANS